MLNSPHYLTHCKWKCSLLRRFTSEWNCFGSQFQYTLPECTQLVGFNFLRTGSLTPGLTKNTFSQTHYQSPEANHAGWPNKCKGW